MFCAMLVLIKLIRLVRQRTGPSLDSSSVLSGHSCRSVPGRFPLARAPAELAVHINLKIRLRDNVDGEFHATAGAILENHRAFVY